MDTAHRETVIWHTDILPRAPRRALDYLARAQWLRQSDWYLAGGTALALQVGHRSSVDLDFFNPKKDFSAGKLVTHFKNKAWESDVIREGTIYGRLFGAKVSFIAYPFFVPRRPYQRYGALRLLNPADIAVMKIIAVSQRGRKRDFVDLYWYCTRRESLGDIIRCLPEQYPAVAHDYHHILKALTYFADAEADPMPRIFFKASWPGIKAFFRREVTLAARTLLKLR